MGRGGQRACRGWWQVGDDDATRYGGAAVDGPHTGECSFSDAGARSFYSHRIGGPWGAAGGTSCGQDRNVMWTRCIRTRP
jgi:hypothetical protein